MQTFTWFAGFLDSRSVTAGSVVLVQNRSSQKRYLITFISYLKSWKEFLKNSNWLPLSDQFNKMRFNIQGRKVLVHDSVSRFYVKQETGKVLLAHEFEKQDHGRRAEQNWFKRSSVESVFWQYLLCIDSTNDYANIKKYT